MATLAETKCESCDSATKALDNQASAALLKELGKGWKVVDGHHLEKQFDFKDFRQALDFTNRIGEVAESIGQDRKSTRLNSSHTVISYAVFCLKKKKKQPQHHQQTTNHGPSSPRAQEQLYEDPSPL